MSLTDPFFISKLISKSILGELNDQEQVLLVQWLEESPENRRLFESYTNEASLRTDLQYLNSVNVDRGWNELAHKISDQRIEVTEPAYRPGIFSIFRNYRRWSIAAVLVLSGMIAVLIFEFSKKPQLRNQFSENYKNDVLPGGKVAQLILSDGTVVDLKENANNFTEQDGTLVNTFAGNLDYSQDDRKNSVDHHLFNTLRVPKGGNYQITMADGTNVQLNAGSELRFPVHFSGTSREVFLKGEGYFSVSKDKNRPFRVKANGSTVEVLGTEFNVNLYAGTIRTTLVEGSVKLKRHNLSKILRPGELGSIHARGISVEKADLRKTLAWKNKEFFFNADHFKDVLSQLALWYDLDVNLDPALADLKISGSIDKNVRLSEVLLMLKIVANCHFELQGKSLTVTKSKRM